MIRVAQNEHWYEIPRIANTVAHERGEVEPFGQPEIKDWWAGGIVEEYPEARIILVGDETVRIVAKSDRLVSILAETARRLGVWSSYRNGELT